MLIESELNCNVSSNFYALYPTAPRDFPTPARQRTEIHLCVSSNFYALFPTTPSAFSVTCAPADAPASARAWRRYGVERWPSSR